jgi:hypothetical protein
VLEGEISRVSLLTIAVRGWGKHRTPHPLFFTLMENYDIYTSTTNREYKEQAEKAMKMYYDTFEEIETVRVSPRLQYVKKRLKREKSSNGSRGNGDGKR